MSFLILYKTKGNNSHDERLLIKKTKSNEKYKLKEALPYKNAKLMYLIEELDEKEQIKEIVIETCKELPIRKKKG